MILKHVKTALLAAVATAALLVVDSKFLHETVILDGNVVAESVRPVLEELTNDGPFLNKLIRTRFLINSNGGSVSAMNMLIRTARASGRQITTEVTNMAASAAADMFLMGDTRLMSKEAQIVIHEVRIMVGNSMITYTDLKSLLETGKLPDNSKADPMIVSIILMSGIEELKELVKEMGIEHENHIVYIMNRTGLSREDVLKNLLIPNVDVYLGLEDALKFNIATGEL